MIQRHTDGRQLIIPIFYDVSPSDVRHQTGSYKKAFYQHERNFNAIIVQRWKEALEKVGKLKGLELEKETYESERRLAKMVVEKVLSELRKNYKNIKEKLVGMDHHLEEMQKLLNVDLQGVRIVGIHGMSGLGKTTIAKFTYNQIYENFELCCFLEDVRETSEQHYGLINLQNQLISKIGRGMVPKINSANEGIRIINDLIRGKNILIILDDVDEKSVFVKLARNWETAGLGSRIIITTRNKEILDQLKMKYQNKGLPEIFRSYEPQMDHDLSVQLFCNYAFMRDLPPEEYVMLSKEIISTAVGIPLVLVTIGSLLFGKDEAYWNETSRKMKDISHEEVMKKLRISYEALNDEQKQIFLDIACLFIGQNKEYPFYMWDDCNYYPESSITALSLRSLVKVRDDNSLWMHDQLRDLGRQIVQESSDELGERSRLWRPDEAFKVLDRCMGTKKVVALALDLPPSPSSGLLGEEFDKMPNVRYLRAGWAYLAGDFKHHLSELRWLECRGCSDEFTPTNCCLENLVILNLSHSEITDNWEGWSQIKMARKLKVLNLWRCSSLCKPLDFSLFAKLEILYLGECSGVSRIDGLKQLESLRDLTISGCKSIEKLLDLSELASLRKLNASDCEELTEIQGLEELKALEFLNISECRSIEKLSNLSKLTNLKQLEASGCGKLTEILGLGSLKSLELLDISKCCLIQKLPDISRLTNLKELRAYMCVKLTEILGLGSLESLELLDISRCHLIQKLPDLSKLKNLKELEASMCVKLTEILGLGGLSLEKLNISGCYLIQK